MLTLSYEFQLKPTSRQAQMMESWWEICRQVGNDGLREREDGLKSRKSPVNACRLGGEYIIPADPPRPTSASQCQTLTPAKKDHPQLKIPQSQVLQQMLRRCVLSVVNTKPAVEAKQTSQICPHCGVHTGKKPLSQ
ncbi:helix-turn-helix domain-containing protein, partial [Geitlerinema sp. PCC 9228]|uniref:helix-turn-helix domain-containing protein n=1 Tax=Geitlerinema sp. PCC 9228 TaxID=111611 RepID=UPI00147D8D54